MEHESAWYLAEARRKMVEHRLSLIKALAGSQGREQSEAHINMIAKVQDAIDVIDRARTEAGVPDP